MCRCREVGGPSVTLNTLSTPAHDLGRENRQINWRSQAMVGSGDDRTPDSPPSVGQTRLEPRGPADHELVQDHVRISPWAQVHGQAADSAQVYGPGAVLEPGFCIASQSDSVSRA